MGRSLENSFMEAPFVLHEVDVGVAECSTGGASALLLGGMLIADLKGEGE